MAFPVGNLAALRTFRVIRALKTVAIIPGEYTFSSFQAPIHAHSRWLYELISHCVHFHVRLCSFLHFLYIISIGLDIAVCVAVIDAICCNIIIVIIIQKL